MTYRRASAIAVGAAISFADGGSTQRPVTRYDEIE